MTCYRKGCKRQCDTTKRMYCLYRLNKAQADLIAKLSNRCPKCSEMLIKARVGKRRVMLCTSCKTVEGEAI